MERRGGAAHIARLIHQTVVLIAAARAGVVLKNERVVTTVRSVHGREVDLQTPAREHPQRALEPHTGVLPQNLLHTKQHAIRHVQDRTPLRALLEA